MASSGSAGAERPACVEVDAGADAELTADRLWALGARAVEERDGSLLAGFSDREAAEQAAAATAGRIVEVDDDAWATAWRAWAATVRVGRLVVHPVWVDLGAVDPDDVVLDLEPLGAFGDGAHATTRLCLAAVERLVRPTMRVLDVGCGSGVLSVAAALLGADVTAVDVDPGAVRVTLDNARRNGVQVDASTTPLPELGGVFDLVLANIGGTQVLVDMAPDLARLGRTIVLAGLLAGRERPAVEALDGYDVERSDDDGGWIAVTLSRRPPL